MAKTFTSPKGSASGDNPYARAPFPYFGGKIPASGMVWEAFGNVHSYVEPFAGSLGMLLQRPHFPFDDTFRRVELVNDLDHFVSNFWRAVKADPEAVAFHAVHPPIERDLSSRHLWLVTEGKRILSENEGDADFYDAKIAGWWAWGLSNWIGTGFCAGEGPWTWSAESREWVKGQGKAVNRKMPHLANCGKGINRQMPHLSDKGLGINRQMPHLADYGKGINRQMPHLGNTGRGIHRNTPEMNDVDYPDFVITPEITLDGTCEAPHVPSGTYDWIRWLCYRLANVRVLCGDWKRTVSSQGAVGGTTIKTVGVFLDPPYTAGMDGVYTNHEKSVYQEVKEWAIEKGANKVWKIALAGYAEDGGMPEGWTCKSWRYRGGYSTTKGEDKELVWFSPGCAVSEPEVEDDSPWGP